MSSYIRFKTLSVILLSSCALVGCSSEQSEKLSSTSGESIKPAASESNAKVSAQKPVPPAKEVKAEAKILTFEQVKTLLSQAEKLHDDACDFCDDYRCADKESIGHAELIGGVIGPWRDRENEWKEKLLTYSSIPMKDEKTQIRMSKALQNLALCEGWFWNAADAASFGKPAKAKLYLRGVKAAIDKAKSVLKPSTHLHFDDPDSGLLSVPDYINGADNSDD